MKLRLETSGLFRKNLEATDSIVVNQGGSRSGKTYSILQVLIIKAHHLLEKHTLTKWQQFQKEQLGNFYGMLLHEGNYLDEVMRNIEVFLEDAQKKVSGDVFVSLYPFQFRLDGIASEHDLMNASFGSYGEMNKGWTADDAKGFIKILSNSGKIYNHVNGTK